MPLAKSAMRSRNCFPAHHRLSVVTTFVEMITSPARSSGASAPEMPKLIRQFACRTAPSTRVVVRLRSPAPTTTEKPAARAIFASAASPQIQSTAADSVISSKAPHQGSNAERHPGRIAVHQMTVTGQSPQGEIGGVAVITQKKHAWKAHRGEPRLIPTSARVLGLSQIGDAPRHRRVADLTRGHQAEQGPGRLRWRAVGRLATGHAGPV